MTGEESIAQDPLAPSRAFVWLFGGFAVASYGYCLVTGTYNGDFFGSEVTLSVAALTVVLGLALLPFAAAWRLFRAVRTGPPGLEVQIPTVPFAIVVAALFAWNIYVTAAYGVAVMMQDVYTAPAAIRPFIQVTNRFNPMLIGMLFILATPRKARYDAPVAVAMLALSVLRASLGALLFLGIVLGYKYFERAVRTRRRLVTAAAIFLVGIPVTAGLLYGLRGSLREEVEQEVALADLVFAQLIGRLSSFSDTAYILQEPGEFAGAVAEMEATFYQRQILGSLVHSSFLPTTTPERILVAVRTGVELETVNHMPGVPGSLALSWMRSRFVFVLNLATLVLLVAGILYAAHQFAHPALKDSGMLLLLYPLTSGVSYEFSNVLLVLVSVLTVAWLARQMGPEA
jgi:hypothetical protein